MSTSGQENGNPNGAVEVQELEEAQRLDISVEQPGTLFQVPSTRGELLSGDVKETVDKFLRFLVLFPDYLMEAYGEYRKPMTTVGLVLIAGLTIAVADGVLDRLNAIPLFAPTFELIGLGFSGWFVFRYLLYADSRQDLKEELDVVKNRIVGSMQQLEDHQD